MEKINNYLERFRWLILATILLMAIFFRFYQINTLDIYRDEAMNAYRAVGMFDFLGTDNFQTSPVNLYAVVPWWSHLSFHDAPPLVFVIWNIFFNLFGDNTLTLRLPFVLAGLIITALIFFVLRRAHGSLAGTLGALTFSFSSYAVWTALSANHEGIACLFALLTIIFFSHFFESHRLRYFLLGALAFSLSLLSKYTTIFLIPVIIGYFILWQRPYLKDKSFWQKPSLD